MITPITIAILSTPAHTLLGLDRMHVSTYALTGNMTFDKHDLARTIHLFSDLVKVIP